MTSLSESVGIDLTKNPRWVEKVEKMVEAEKLHIENFFKKNDKGFRQLRLLGDACVLMDVKMRHMRINRGLAT